MSELREGWACPKLLAGGRGTVCTDMCMPIGPGLIFVGVFFFFFLNKKTDLCLPHPAWLYLWAPHLRAQTG